MVSRSLEGRWPVELFRTRNSSNLLTPEREADTLGCVLMLRYWLP